MCGIVGIITDNGKVVDLVYRALKVLENRGREGSGIMVANALGAFKRITGSGYADEALRVKLQHLQQEIKKDKYDIAIGQDRYGTTGVSSSSNLQPTEGFWQGKDFFLVHNGNVVNLSELKKCYGINCPPHYSDTRIITLAVTQTRANSFEEAIVDVARKLRGSFNLIFYHDQKLYIIKDRFGFHPLQLGRRGKTFLVSSESSVFRGLQAKFIRDVNPGELIIVSREGYVEKKWTKETELRFDIFEFIYFMRHISQAYGVSVSKARKRMGELLADEVVQSLLSQGVDPNNCVVAPIPESGNQASLGLYEEMRKQYPGICYSPRAVYPNSEIKRTFIDPSQITREKMVDEKFDPDENEVAGQIIILVDDSLIRGTTITGIARKLYQRGAKQVHLAIACPQYLYPCVYGVDTYRLGEILISAVHHGDQEFIARAVGIQSVSFLDLYKTIQAVLDCKSKSSPLTNDSFYAGPFNRVYNDGTGDYPIH
jgi:amidophosphoribosyltransferase